MQRGQQLVLAALSTALSTGGLSACLSERSYEPERQDDGRGMFELPAPDVGAPEQEPLDDDVRSALITGVVDGHLRGDIGPALGLDTATSTLNHYDDGYYAAIEAVVVRPERAAMMMVSASNPNVVFAPGTHRTFRLSDYEEDGTALSVLGCTGATEGYYDEFDYPADEVEVIVEPADGQPGEVVVQVNARWITASPEQPQEASSSFTLRY